MIIKNEDIQWHWIDSEEDEVELLEEIVSLWGDFHLQLLGWKYINKKRRKLQRSQGDSEKYLVVQQTGHFHLFMHMKIVSLP